LQGLETTRQKRIAKTKKEEEIEYKLAEGIRRQKAGLQMWDEDEGGTEFVYEVSEDELDE
jgi:hypothetical protein